MGPGRRSLLLLLLLPLLPLLLPSACATDDLRPCPAAAQLGRRGGQDREPRLLQGHQRHAAVRGGGGGQGEGMSRRAGGRRRQLAHSFRWRGRRGIPPPWAGPSSGRPGPVAALPTPLAAPPRSYAKM